MVFAVSGTKAYLIGNVGASEVEFVTGMFGQVTFVEWTPSGVAQVTMILKDGRAVHSRHTLMGVNGEDLLNSQVVGRCEHRQ
jgi:hypothetical protein